MRRYATIDDSTGSDHRALFYNYARQQDCTGSNTGAISDRNCLSAADQPSKVKPILINHRPTIVAADDTRPDKDFITKTCAWMELCAMTNQASVSDRRTVYD